MRTKKSVINSVVSILSYSLSILIAFIAQKIFINILNIEYLGINGLFSNIITMLSIAELGIGEAIIFNLYKPIKNNDQKQINRLLSFYKKAYNVIAVTIFLLGLCLIPFLNSLVGTTNLDVNLKIIYFIFLLQTVSTYLFSYKRSLIYANQKNYIINIIHSIYLILLNVIQLLILYITKNYYIYLIIKILCNILENFAITYVANKLFPFIRNVKKDNLDKETEQDIIKRVKAQLLHKIGGTVVNGTDNILISKLVGIAEVGLCSNYFLILNAVKNLFSQIITSITASIGDLLIENNSDKSFSIYKKIRFLNFWVTCLACSLLIALIQDFIILWLGEEFLLPYIVIITLIINQYQKMMRVSNDTFLVAAGICVENKYVPIAESILNIIFSLLFCKMFGLVGIFLGTIVSGMALWCYSYPKFVYKKLFNKSNKDFALETIGYFILFIILITLTIVFMNLISINNLFLKLIIKTIFTFIFINVILIILFHKQENFIYYKSLIFNIINKKFK